MASDAVLHQPMGLKAEFRAAADDVTAARLNRQPHAMPLEASRNRFLPRAMRGCTRPC